MKKYVVIILMFLLVVLVSCSAKHKTDINLAESEKNENIHNTTTDNNESNIVPYQINSGSTAFDGENIFYIDNNTKLYNTKKDGKEKKLIFDKITVNLIQIHNNKIYMLCFNYQEDIPSKICYINKDGTGFDELQLNLELSSKYYISHFVIYDDLLFFTVNDFTNTNEIDFPRDFYKYEFESGKLTSVYEDMTGYRTPRIYDDIYYCHEFGTAEYDVLHTYNVETNEKNIVRINKNSHKEKVITSSFHICDSYMYYSGKTYIDRDSTDSSSDTTTLFEDNSFMITTMTMNEEYIFFINREDYKVENSDIYNTNTNIYRMKLDGSETKNIFRETMYNTNISPQTINIITDNILLYRNRLTNTIIAMDFDGNILDWGL